MYVNPKLWGAIQEATFGSPTANDELCRSIYTHMHIYTDGLYTKGTRAHTHREFIYTHLHIYSNSPRTACMGAIHEATFGLPTANEAEMCLTIYRRGVNPRAPGGGAPPPPPPLGLHMILSLSILYGAWHTRGD